MEHTERGDCSNVRALFVRMACALLFAKWSFRGIASQALSASKRHTAEKESCFFVDFSLFFPISSKFGLSREGSGQGMLMIFKGEIYNLVAFQDTIEVMRPSPSNFTVRL